MICDICPRLEELGVFPDIKELTPITTRNSESKDELNCKGLPPYVF